MSKRALSLYIDSNLIEIARNSNPKINFSELFENFLRNYVESPAMQSELSLEKLQALESEQLAELNRIKALKLKIKSKETKYFKEVDVDQ